MRLQAPHLTRRFSSTSYLAKQSAKVFRQSQRFSLVTAIRRRRFLIDPTTEQDHWVCHLTCRIVLARHGPQGKGWRQAGEKPSM
jgi:hypothetical protein